MRTGLPNAGIMAYARQASLLDRMEVVANNISNVNTSGFKQDLAVFLTPQGRNPMPPMRVAVDTSQAGFKQTNRQFDVAIQGNGFFQIETPLGPRYTRSGAFVANDQGQLVDKDGNPVVGDGGVISLQPEDNQVKIGDNGEIYAVTATGMELRGVIGVFKFSDPSSLKKTGNSTFTSDQSPEVAAVNEDFKMAQGMLEDSNVNSVEQMTEMIEVTRDVQLIAKIINDQHNLQKSAVQRLTAK